MATKSKTATTTKAPPVVVAFVSTNNPYRVVTDANKQAWDGILAAITAKVPLATLRSKKDTPITGARPGTAHTFVNYCLRRKWLTKVDAKGAPIS